MLQTHDKYYPAHGDTSVFANGANPAPLLYRLTAADHLAHLCVKHHDSSRGSRGPAFIFLQHTSIVIIVC